MMPTLEGQSRSTARRFSRGAVLPLFSETLPTHFVPPPKIRRKSACACGGGCPACQAKSALNISQPNDPAEIEADQIAERVMRMSVDDAKPQSELRHKQIKVHRKCKNCEADDSESSETGWRKEVFAAGTRAVPRDTPANIRTVITSGGQPLDAQTRRFFEPRFGYGLHNVRIHTDPSAGQSARSINARAYTLGSDIVFGNGEYQPETESGRHLLAHELVHVIQSTTRSDHESIYRYCLSGSACTEPIPGAPGQMISAGIREAEPARERREADPVAARAAGHGRRAVNLERFARENGIDLSVIGGIFVDLDVPSGWGAYRLPCSRFSFPTAWTGDASIGCVFFPNDRETQAETYYADPAADSIGGRSRTLWEVIMRQFLTHEVQHERFARYSAAGAASQSGCARDMVIYTSPDGNVEKTVDGYLTELSAIMSEFQPLFRGIGDRPVLEYVRPWFNYKVDTASESMRGVITAIRCHCECDAMNAYIQDTFEFTSRGWSRAEKAVFNSIMGTWPGLGWPLQVDPQCLPECETNFTACLRSSADMSGMGSMRCIAHRGTCLNSCGDYARAAGRTATALMSPTPSLP